MLQITPARNITRKLTLLKTLRLQKLYNLLPKDAVKTLTLQEKVSFSFEYLIFWHYHFS